MIKRTFDFLFAVLIGVAAILPILGLAAVVRISSPGPIFHWSERVGKCNRIFWMPKFRTMKVGAPVLATHLLRNSAEYLTPVGSLLRRTSLDELPQIWSILVGDMSFVGPRPALFNQEDLISLRVKYGIDSLLPGLTGWAQVNGRDELSTIDKVSYDLEYLNRKSFWFDIKIIYLTFLKVMRQSGVAH